MRTILIPLIALVIPAISAAQGKEIDPEDLRPGLIATYRVGEQEITRLEPTVAVLLKDNESPHPRLAASAGSYRWTGYLNLFRRGNYTFSAKIRGKVEVKLDGKVVFSADHAGPESKEITGASIPLEATTSAIEVTYTRPQGAAQLELRWLGPNFRDEPLNWEALGHLPNERPKAYRGDALSDHGRLVFEEHACIKCHQSDSAMAKTLADRAGPNLTKVGERSYPGWIYSWLGDPQKLRPDTVMPDMFSDDATGQAEQYAVAKYLASLGGPMKSVPPARNMADTVKSGLRGQNYFTTLGCAACHSANDPKVKPESVLDGFIHRQQYQLTKVGSKTRPDMLVKFLENPLATHPSGRMPSLNLDRNIATDLANYLCSTSDDAISQSLPDAPAADVREKLWKALPAPEAWSKLYDAAKDEQKWDVLGQRLFQSKGCVNCHTIDGAAKLPTITLQLPKLEQVKAKSSAGCLSETPNQAPRFGLNAFEREAVSAFLQSGCDGSGAPAPAFQTRQSLTRFNCLNCHQRQGEGGLPTELMASMSKLEKAENADAVAPPTLTGVGHKLRTSWLKQVLTAAGRARPWMGLRMPQYGEANVGHLTEGLATIEAANTDDKIYQPTLSAQKIEAGRLLIGKNGFGCISCHDIAGIENTGTRGPDLTTTNQRVRYDWFRTWMEQPLRMAPGTRMPQVFNNGKSQIESVMNGSADAQSEAMWAYLSLGQNLPLPAGLEPPKGRTIIVGTKPEILRTFMPEAGNKAIAVGYPGGQSLVFDAQRCRLSYAWAGNFLDASPVWDNRGGAPAKLLGPRYWSSPPGNPWAISGSREAPDFLTRSKDPGYGADLPDGQMYQGPFSVHFDGYTLDAMGYPSFKYRIDGAAGVTLKVVERPEPIRAAVAAGVLRRFTLESPSKEFPWMLVGETAGEPRVVNAAGEPQTIDLKAGAVELPVADRIIVLPANNGGVLAARLDKAPADSVWRIQPRAGGGWLLVLKLPDRGGKQEVDLAVWSVAKDEANLLRSLSTK